MTRAKEPMALPKFYRNLSIIFFFATFILAFGVFYYIYGRLNITVFPVFQKAAAEANIEIKKNAQREPAKDSFEARGEIYEFFVQEKAGVPASGTKLVLDDTIGSVAVINNHTQDQTLVATTRLLAPDGTLLRLKDRVQIPKGAKLAARVYPDKPESFSKLEPVRFTIPGLSADLQKKIFAESTKTLTKDGKKITIVTTDDRNLVEKKILERVDAKAAEILEEKVSEEEALFTKLIQKEIQEKKISAGVGDESEAVEAEVSAKITAVVFDEIAVANIMKRKLSEELSAGRELKELDPKSLVYTLNSYDVKSGIAKIKVYGEGRAQVKSESELFDKKKLFGRGEREIMEYFKTFKEVENIKIEFSPSWLRRAPRFEDRIEILVE